MLAITRLRIFKNTQSAVNKANVEAKNNIIKEEIPRTKLFYDWMMECMKRTLIRIFGKSEEYAKNYIAKFEKELMERAHKELPEYYFQPGMEEWLYEWLNKRALEENRRLRAEGPGESTTSGKRLSIIA